MIDYLVVKNRKRTTTRIFDSHGCGKSWPFHNEEKGWITIFHQCPFFIHEWDIRAYCRAYPKKTKRMPYPMPFQLNRDEKGWKRCLPCRQDKQQEAEK